MRRTRFQMLPAPSAMPGACAPGQVKQPRQGRQPLHYPQPAQLDIQEFQPAPEPGSEAGKKTGEIVCARLLENGSFRAEMEALRNRLGQK